MHKTLSARTRHPRGLFRRLFVQTDATAALEAALTLPIVLFMMIGMLEMFFYMEASRRVTTAAQLTADLISRQAQLNTGTGPTTSTNISSIFSATALMLEPLSATTSNLNIDAASILFNNPSLTTNNLSCTASATGPASGERNGIANYCHGIDWEQTYGTGATNAASTTTVYTSFADGCTSSSLAACYCVLNSATIALATPTCLAAQSLIYVQVAYTYTDPIKFILPFVSSSPSVVIKATAYLTPRTVSYVPMCSTTATSSCV